jgi:DNA-directed RNA polymerase specialized sigma24 family protein
VSQPSPESGAFEHFLSRLDATDRERAGVRYEELRHSLIRVFRWRGCSGPEDLADETLARAMTKSVTQAIEDMPRFVHGIARLIALEDHRRHARDEQSLREANVVRMPPPPGDPRLDCLDECLGRLGGDDRVLIVSYYSGSGSEKIESRRRLAESLRLSLTTLRVRAHRVRERLEGCLRGCLEAR